MWFEGMEWLDEMEDMLKENNEVNFTVHMKPYEISLICPHCNTNIYVNWNEIDEPEYWDNSDWGSIYCPCCGKEISFKEEIMEEEFKTNPYCKEFLIFTPTITDNKVEVGDICAGNKVDSLKTVKDRLSTEKVVWINNEYAYALISMFCENKIKTHNFSGKGLYQIGPDGFMLRYIPNLISYYNSEYNQIMLYDINKYIKLVNYFDDRIANIIASFKQN